MATWAQFAAARPDLAERGFRHLMIPLAYLATVRRDGTPRLHPLSPMFADGRLFVAIMGTSPRRFDLARDGRYSLHALPPMLGPDYDEFEFNVTGRAKLVKDPEVRAAVSEAERRRSRPPVEDEHWLFELDIEMVLTTVWQLKMAKKGDQWLPVLDGEMPKPARQVWRAT